MKRFIIPCLLMILLPALVQADEQWTPVGDTEAGNSYYVELSSLKKKFKDKKFAAGCSRDVIKQGAEMLGWELDKLLEESILAMRSCEEKVNNQM